MAVSLVLLAGCAQARAPRPPQPAVQAALPGPALARDRFFTTSDGVRLHYSVAGAGDTIVFVPGWDMPAWIFQAQLREFSRTYRVVGFDPRGQGSSDIPEGGYEPGRRAADIGELLGQLGGDPAVLVGWSLGVLDVLALVQAQGDARVAGLVLIDNSVGEAPAPPPERRPRRGRHAAPAPREVAMRRFVDGMFLSHQPEDYLERLTQTALRVPERASAALLAYPVPRSYWRAAVYGTTRPVLYVVRPGLAGQADNLARLRPDTQSVVLAHVGHALFVDDPNRFDALLADFLRRRVWPQ